MEKRTRTAAHEDIARMRKFEKVIQAFSEPNPRIKEADVASVLETSMRGLENARANTQAILLTEELL